VESFAVRKANRLFVELLGTPGAEGAAGVIRNAHGIVKWKLFLDG
jgi:hypothetical protein